MPNTSVHICECVVSNAALHMCECVVSNTGVCVSNATLHMPVDGKGRVIEALCG